MKNEEPEDKDLLLSFNNVCKEDVQNISKFKTDEVKLKSHLLFRLLGPQKGFAVHFGHPSWNMVLNMMVGIRIAAGRINNEPRRRLEPYDFIMKEKISILPKSANLIETNLSNPNIVCNKY